MVIAHSGVVGPLTDALAPESIPKQRKLGKTEVERWVEAVKKLNGKGAEATG